MTRALSITALLVTACTDPPPEPPIDGALQVSVSSLEVGPVTCGTQRTSSFQVSNPSTGTLEAAILTTLPGVTVTPDRIALGAFESATIEVTAAVPQTATPGFVSRGDLVIGSNGGSVTLPLTFSSAGAVVTIDRPVVDFGELVTRASTQRTLTVSVTGTTGATVTLGPSSSASFGIVEPGALVATSTATLAANTSHTFALRMTTGATEQALAATLPLVVSGDLCAPPPAEVALTGVATNELLTISTTSIDFGSPPCAKFSTAEIEMTNHGTTDVAFHITRSDPAGFISGEFSSVFLDGIVFAGETETTQIVHARVPFELDLPIGDYFAQLEVELNQAVKKTIPIFTSIDRPIMKVSTDRIDAGTVFLSPFEKTFVVTNEGNRPDDIHVVTNAVVPGATVEVSPQAFQLEPLRSQTVTVKVKPLDSTSLLINVGLVSACEADTVVIEAN